MNDFVIGAPADRLPTLVRTPSGYRVHDPQLIAGTHYAIDEQGDLVYTRLPAGSIVATVVLGSAVAGLWIGGDSWAWFALTFLLALPTGFALAAGLLGLIHVSTNPVRRYRAVHGHGRYAIDVTDRESGAWALCRRAERLAATPSWVSGRVDPTRTLGSLLWTAVADEQSWAAESLNQLVEPATGPDLQSV
ncbi:hypothetical protein EV383_1417 [Pseudonocardia sediminis]|uniref:Uncharacterized protein n=1 Tax=Pseudonocardia sediminis TaxID=1397368 RepID=A0A4V2FQF6_PSEST|nr:hypothetical protein [Pseudonocardia sediminis]RZT84570.1 hypothetical protein EV383_1417 [Pseudonocardia sediminis]